MKTCSSCGRIYVSPRDFLKNTSRWRKCSLANLYFNCSCGSTIVLPKGKYNWYSPDLLMSQQASSVFNNFSNTASIPYLPTVAIEMVDLLNNVNTSLAVLAEVCKRDPALSAQLIACANIARNPTTEPVFKLEQAIGLLGRTRISALTLVAALSNFEIKTKRYGKVEHFAEAFTIGLVAEHLATVLKLDIPADLAYVAGSFCNIGKLLGAIFFHEETDKVYDRVQNFKDPTHWVAAETELETTGHHILGEIACVLWGMPEEVFAAVQFHHQPVLPSNTPLNLTQKTTLIVTFANQLSHYLNFNSHRVQSEVLESCLTTFNMKNEKLESVLAGLRPSAAHARRFLESTFSIH